MAVGSLFSLLVASLDVGPHGSDGVRADSRQMSDVGSFPSGESRTSKRPRDKSTRFL